VRYLRTLFEAYLNGSGGTELEHQLLGKWNKDYYRSKFVVLSREGNMFGGTLIVECMLIAKVTVLLPVSGTT